MQGKAEFDSYVGTYDADHRKSIRLSGESPDFFADYKIAALARMVRNKGLRADRILDFGAGIGNSLPPFRRHFPDADLTLSDVSQDSLDLAAEKYGAKEEQLHIRAGRLPAENDSFDIVFSACVFHHIPEKEHIGWLEELRRITRPGGRLVVFEHNPWNPLTQHAVANCPFDENAVLISGPELARRFARASWARPAIQYHMFFPSPLATLRRFEPFLGFCPLGAQYACIGEAPR
ncbi:MAG: methyltransferase domain-containing protein [Pseudomonadota bacterium]